MENPDQAFRVGVSALLDHCHTLIDAYVPYVADDKLSVLRNVGQILYSLEQEIENERDTS